MEKLKCINCGSELKLAIGYTGCDWDTLAGEGSGYGWEISLDCIKYGCGRVYHLGNIKELNDFAELKEEKRCVL